MNSPTFSGVSVRQLLDILPSFACTTIHNYAPNTIDSTAKRAHLSLLPSGDVVAAGFVSDNT
jgi:hypothetical protein